MARRRRWVIATGLLVVVAAFVLAAGRPLADLALNEGHVLVEKAIGQTPERRVAAYFAALRRGDRSGALAVWSLLEQAPDDLRVRREAITDELLSLGPSLRYSIIVIEWWRNCCEPGPAGDPAGAGVARVRLSVSRGDGPELRFYTLDVTTPSTYWGAAAGDPVRRWLLRDVYHSEDAPIAFPWPSADADADAGSAQLQSLAETERDQSQWLTYTSTDWGISLRYPPGWSVVEVVYGRPDYGPVIRVAAGDRVLELVRRGSLPPGPLLEWGTGSIGPFPARRYLDDDDFGPPEVLLLPLGAGDAVAYAQIELRDTADDGYLELFRAVLASVSFG